MLGIVLYYAPLKFILRFSHLFEYIALSERSVADEMRMACFAFERLYQTLLTEWSVERSLVLISTCGSALGIVERSLVLLFARSAIIHWKAWRKLTYRRNRLVSLDKSSDECSLIHLSCQGIWFNLGTRCRGNRCEIQPT